MKAGLGVIITEYKNSHTIGLRLFVVKLDFSKTEPDLKKACALVRNHLDPGYDWAQTQ